MTNKNNQDRYYTNHNVNYYYSLLNMGEYLEKILSSLN